MYFSMNYYEIGDEKFLIQFYCLRTTFFWSHYDWKALFFIVKFVFWLYVLCSVLICIVLFVVLRFFWLPVLSFATKICLPYSKIHELYFNLNLELMKICYTQGGITKSPEFSLAPPHAVSHFPGLSCFMQLLQAEHPTFSSAHGGPQRLVTHAWQD